MRVKLLLWMLLLVILSSNIYATTVSYMGTPASYAQGIRNGHNWSATATQAVSESFNISGIGTYRIDQIELPLSQITGGADNVRISIYHTNDSFEPVGTAIGYSEYNDVSVTTGAVCTSIRNFNFTGITLNLSTEYVFVVSAADSGTDKNYRVCTSGSNYTDGNMTLKADGGGVISINNDIAFNLTYVVLNSNFTITATDDFNGSSINAFSAYINSTWYHTTNGTITTDILSNTSSLFNITINTTDYFNRTHTNYNISSGSLATSLYQAILCLNSTEKVSGSEVTDVLYYTGTKNSTSCFNVTAATHSVIATKTGWYNQTQSFTLTALEQENGTIYNLSHSRANITVYRANGSVIPAYNITISSQNYTNWTGETLTATAGNVTFDAINGTYNAQVTSSEGTENFTFILDAYAENITLRYFAIGNCSTYTVPTLNFTILNEETLALLNDSILGIYLNITSNYYTGSKEYNFSFSSGNYYALCVPASTISGWTANAQMEYSKLSDYVEKEYWLVDYPLTSSQTSINLYLTNGTTQTKLQVRDYNDDGVSANTYVKVLSYDLATDSSLVTEIIKTDADGNAYAQLIQNTAYYSFIVEKDGEIVLQTSPIKITATTYTLRVNLETDYFDQNYDVVQGITHSLTYTNATTTFHFTYSDPTNDVQQGCLKITKRSINGDTVINTSCTISSASTIDMNISDSPGTNTYIANSYVIFSDGTNIALNSTSTTFNTTYKKFGGGGLFLAFLIILCLVMVGIWHPAIAITMAVLGVIATVVMNLIFLTWTSVVVIVIIAGIAIFRTGRSD